MNNITISYAQNREDIILSGFFPEVEKGFYVDVGANHPTNDSVTKLFYARGWNGINIEPNRKLLALLEADRTRDINLGVGVAGEAGRLMFREYHNHGLSTFSHEMMSEYQHNPSAHTNEYRDYEVDLLPLAQIFTQYKVEHIHFLKIDIEGYEYEALVGNDWEKYRPEVICIESNHIVKDWHKLILGQNYSLAFFDGLNDYYLAGEAKQRATNFSYPDVMLLGPVVVPFNLYKEQKRLEGELQAARLETEELGRELERTKQELKGASGGIVHNTLALLRSFDIAIIKRLNTRTSAGPKKLDLVEGTTPITAREQYLRNYIDRPKHHLARIVRKGYSALRALGRKAKRATRSRRGVE